MTTFGLEIRSNRQRPDWLQPDEIVEVEIEGWYWIGAAGKFKWADVASFKLPEDHAFYRNPETFQAA